MSSPKKRKTNAEREAELITQMEQMDNAELLDFLIEAACESQTIASFNDRWTGRKPRAICVAEHKEQVIKTYVLSHMMP
jgi:hypothetical protein